MAIVNLETDPVIALGAVLAEKMYGKAVPIVDRPERNPIKVISTGDIVKIDAKIGIIEVIKSQDLTT